MKYQTSLMIVLAALLLGASCSVGQTVDLELDGSGISTLEVKLHPVFLQYYKELASGFNPSFDPKNPRIFNVEALRQNFAANQGLVLTSAASEAPERLSLSFRFAEFTDVIRNQDSRIRDLISVSKGPGRETVKIHLDRQNLTSILKLTPDGNSPIAQMLLPPEGRNLSETDYIEQLAWALEEYAGDGDIKKIIADSAVNLTVRVKGKIIEQTGGNINGDSEVRFRIPIVKLFTLNKPLEYSVTYRRISP